MATLPTQVDFLTAESTKNDALNGFIQLHNYLNGLLGSGGSTGEALAKLGAIFNSVIHCTGTYTVTAADRGRIVACNGDFAVNLPAASTLEAGFPVCIVNIGSGTVTLTSIGSDTVAGLAEYPLGPNTSVIAARVGEGWILNGSPQLSDAIDSDSSLTAASSRALNLLRETLTSNAQFHSVGTYAILIPNYQTAHRDAWKPGHIAAGSTLLYPNGVIKFTSQGYSSESLYTEGSWLCMGLVSSNKSSSYPEGIWGTQCLYLRIA